MHVHDDPLPDQQGSANPISKPGLNSQLRLLNLIRQCTASVLLLHNIYFFGYGHAIHNYITWNWPAKSY